MKEAPDSSETSVLTRATRRNNPEDTILHSHRRENLKSYNNPTHLALIVGVDLYLRWRSLASETLCSIGNRTMDNIQTLLTALIHSSLEDLKFLLR
jgi:hypothetical protein